MIEKSVYGCYDIWHINRQNGIRRGEKMGFRQAVAGDLDGIEEGYLEHFAHEKKYGAYTVFQEGVYPTRKVAETALQNSALYVYEENGDVLGSFILDKQQPEEYQKIEWPSNAPNEKVMVIHLLMVRPSAAGKGIGSCIVSHAIDTAQQQACVAVRLDTGEQNIPAASLYKKLGFNLVSTSQMKVGCIISHNRHLFFEKIV